MREKSCRIREIRLNLVLPPPPPHPLPSKQKERDGKKGSERVLYRASVISSECYIERVLCPCVKLFSVVSVDKRASSLKALPSKTPAKADEKVNMTVTALDSVVHNYCYFNLITSNVSGCMDYFLKPLRRNAANINNNSNNN